MSISIIAPYEITLATGLEFYPSAGSPLVTRLASQMGTVLARNFGNSEAFVNFLVAARYLGADAVSPYITHDTANAVLKYKGNSPNTPGILGAVTVVGSDLRAGYARCRVTNAPAGGNYAGFCLRSDVGNMDSGFQFAFNSVSGKFIIHKAGTGPVATSTASYVMNTWYRFYFSIAGTTITFKIYDDSNVLIETLTVVDGAFSTYTYGGYWFYCGFNFESSWLAIGTNTEDMVKNYFSTISPAATHKFNISGNSIDNVADCLNYIENSLGGTGSLTYKYNLNNAGILPADPDPALILADLKIALRAAAVTVHGTSPPSLIVYVNHVSDGVKQVENGYGRTNAVGGGLHVVDPAGGGGISKARLINTGGF